jgi:EAL domain-containing protein (putative c-di-GMP-specific phosphodiesterase class I)
MDFTFAFQPIVDINTGSAYSHEALVRGRNNEPASIVLTHYRREEMPVFDASCRAKAIELAARIGVHSHLNINLIPSAAFDRATGLDATIKAAERCSFPLDRIIVEATEGEAIHDPAAFAKVVNEYRRAGIRFAIDDFGSGYAGLNLLAEFQPDMLKLDMSLVRGIEKYGARQAIVRGIKQVCFDLGIDVVVEGVEKVAEYSWFRKEGMHLYQGYLFAKPSLESMPVCISRIYHKNSATRISSTPAKMENANNWAAGDHVNAAPDL